MIILMMHGVVWSSELSKLCLSQEKIVFSCETEGGKSISLCAGEMSDWTNYIQYRFGDDPSNGLFFPKDLQRSLKKFTYDHTHKTVQFVQEDLMYQIGQHPNSNDTNNFMGVVISSNSDVPYEILRIPCTSYPMGNLEQLHNKIGGQPTSKILSNRIRGLIDLQLGVEPWGPIVVYETSQTSKRSRDTLSFESIQSIQRKYQFRFVGQRRVISDEIRFVGWFEENQKKQFEETDIAIPFSLREIPNLEDIFWIRKSDLHPIFLQRKGNVVPQEPWLCCNNIDFYSTSSLKDKRGEIIVEEEQLQSMQLIWRQGDKQKVLFIH